MWACIGPRCVQMYCFYPLLQASFNNEITVLITAHAPNNELSAALSLTSDAHSRLPSAKVPLVGSLCLHSLR